jgi:hypothetical protein
MIDAALARSAVWVAVIGPQWANAENHWLLHDDADIGTSWSEGEGRARPFILAGFGIFGPSVSLRFLVPDKTAAVRGGHCSSTS